MQLLNSPPGLPALSHATLGAVLQDIANKIELTSNFGICHPEYSALELPEEAIADFQRLPAELQHKFWRSRLQGFLYGIYYNGSLRKRLALNAGAVELDLQQNLENNTFQGVDLQFYERLHASNGGEGNFEPEWKVLSQEDSSLRVTKDGLTLYVDRDRHLLPEQRMAPVGDRVAIRLPKNRVQSGFYLAVGNASSPMTPDAQAQTVRIYCNVNPEGAVLLMSQMTRQFNDANIPFRFKALYNPADYERYDAAVLYIEKQDYERVWALLQPIYLEAQPDFQPETPLFTKVLAPGLGLAEEPDHKFTTQESFGTHRCRIVANGLLEAWQTGNNSPEARIQAIVSHFSCLGIDLSRPYLNANSEDIYQLIQPC